MKMPQALAGKAGGKGTRQHCNCCHNWAQISDADDVLRDACLCETGDFGRRVTGAD